MLRGSSVLLVVKAANLGRPTGPSEEGPALTPSGRVCLSLATLLSTRLIVASDTVPRYLLSTRVSSGLHKECILTYPIFK